MKTTIKIDLELDGLINPVGFLRQMAKEAERKSHGHKYSDAHQRGAWETLADALREAADEIPNLQRQSREAAEDMARDAAGEIEG